MKASLNSIQIFEEQLVALENVIEIVIQNYSIYVIDIVMKGVSRRLPAVDPITGTPNGSFTMNALGHTFDIEFNIVINGSKVGSVGNVVIDYSTLKKC